MVNLNEWKTPAGRLREEGAREILRRKALGETYRKIAHDLNVTIGTVFNVCRGATWGWIR